LVKQALKQWDKSYYIPPNNEKKELKAKLDNLHKDNEQKDITAQLQSFELDLQIKYLRVVKEK